jgi:predicted RNase H-like HicB family nuclease
VPVAIHDDVLRVARRVCRERRTWTFSVEEVVRALPELNEHSVRAHVASRCCVNAPANHPHRWAYFRRVGRGEYELLPAYRTERGGARAARGVAESAARYGGQTDAPRRDSIHAVVHRDGSFYVAECLEIAVVTQGRTADDVLANLQEAIALHLEGEDRRALGLADNPRLVVTYEVFLARDGAEA